MNDVSEHSIVVNKWKSRCFANGQKQTFLSFDAATEKWTLFWLQKISSKNSRVQSTFDQTIKATSREKNTVVQVILLFDASGLFASQCSIHVTLWAFSESCIEIWAIWIRNVCCILRTCWIIFNISWGRCRERTIQVSGNRLARVWCRHKHGHIQLIVRELHLICSFIITFDQISSKCRSYPCGTVQLKFSWEIIGGDVCHVVVWLEIVRDEGVLVREISNGNSNGDQNSGGCVDGI